MRPVTAGGSATLTEHGIPIRNIWYMLLYAWNHADEISHWRADVESAPNLDALLASVLAGLMEQRLRRGLGRAYATKERSVRGVRGRIIFTESVRRQLFDRGEAHCRFPEFTADVPRNRIVKAIVRRLVSVGVMGPDDSDTAELRHRLRQIGRALYDVGDTEPSVAMIAREPLGRNDADYRVMLNICALFLQRWMPTEFTGESMVPSANRSELGPLYLLFERFVARFYAYHLADWDVFPHRTLFWHQALESPYLPVMIPDLLLKHQGSGSLIILDTKFTKESLPENQSNQKRFDSNHLYQIYTYLRTQEHLSEAHRHASGILLYPSVDSDLREQVVVQGHALRIESVDFASPWPEIEARLLGLVSAPTCSEAT